MRMRGLVFLILCTTLCCVPTRAEEFVPISAKATVLIERTSGRILYAQNEREILPIASTTKIMTALLAIELTSLDEPVTTGANASGVEGTSLYLREGETLTMRNMLYGLMLRSGNDAAVAIAEHIDGTVEHFANRMNMRALELGAQSHFVTPNGLDKDDNGASALGIARIAAKALEYPAFREIVSTKEATIPWPGREYARALENKNKLLRHLPGATGVKTGFTNRAGRCLVFSCERDGMELVGAVLHCGTWFESATALTEWGFARYRPRQMWNAGDTAQTASVSGGRTSSVDALYAKSLALPLAQGEEPEVLLQLFPLQAPVFEGQLIGHAVVNVDGETACCIDLIASTHIEPRPSFREALIQVLKGWLRAISPTVAPSTAHHSKISDSPAGNVASISLSPSRSSIRSPLCSPSTARRTAPFTLAMRIRNRRTPPLSTTNVSVTRPSSGWNAWIVNPSR